MSQVCEFKGDCLRFFSVHRICKSPYFNRFVASSRMSRTKYIHKGRFLCYPTSLALLLILLLQQNNIRIHSFIQY